MIKFAHVAKILPMRTILTASTAATVTLTVDDLGSIVVFTGSDNTAVVIPSAAGAGAGAWITIVCNGTTDLSVSTAGADNINGATPNTDMATQYESETYISTGSEWIILSKVAI
jgi:hypothetical protein